MHHPAKDDVFICGAVNKLVQEKSYVFNHHGFCLFCHLKGAGVPAPIAIKKHTVFKQFVRSATYSRFADTMVPPIRYSFCKSVSPLSADVVCKYKISHLLLLFNCKNNRDSQSYHFWRFYCIFFILIRCFWY